MPPVRWRHVGDRCPYCMLPDDSENHVKSCEAKELGKNASIDVYECPSPLCYFRSTTKIIAEGHLLESKECKALARSAGVAKTKLYRFELNPAEIVTKKETKLRHIRADSELASQARKRKRLAKKLRREKKMKEVMEPEDDDVEETMDPCQWEPMHDDTSVPEVRHLELNQAETPRSRRWHDFVTVSMVEGEQGTRAAIHGMREMEKYILEHLFTNLDEAWHKARRTLLERLSACERTRLKYLARHRSSHAVLHREWQELSEALIEQAVSLFARKYGEFGELKQDFEQCLRSEMKMRHPNTVRASVRDIVMDSIGLVYSFHHDLTRFGLSGSCTIELRDPIVLSHALLKKRTVYTRGEDIFPKHISPTGKYHTVAGFHNSKRLEELEVNLAKKLLENNNNSDSHFKWDEATIKACRVLPIALYTDKTVTSFTGMLSETPIILELLLFSPRAMRWECTKSVVGFIKTPQINSSETEEKKRQIRWTVQHLAFSSLFFLVGAWQNVVMRNGGVHFSTSSPNHPSVSFFPVVAAIKGDNMELQSLSASIGMSNCRWCSSNQKMQIEGFGNFPLLPPRSRAEILEQMALARSREGKKDFEAAKMAFKRRFGVHFRPGQCLLQSHMSFLTDSVYTALPFDQLHSILLGPLKALVSLLFNMINVPAVDEFPDWARNHMKGFVLTRRKAVFKDFLESQRFFSRKGVMRGRRTAVELLNIAYCLIAGFLADTVVNTTDEPDVLGLKMEECFPVVWAINSFILVYNGMARLHTSESIAQRIREDLCIADGCFNLVRESMGVPETTRLLKTHGLFHAVEALTLFGPSQLTDSGPLESYLRKVKRFASKVNNKSSTGAHLLRYVVESVASDLIENDEEKKVPETRPIGGKGGKPEYGPLSAPELCHKLKVMLKKVMDSAGRQLPESLAEKLRHVTQQSLSRHLNDVSKWKIWANALVMNAKLVVENSRPSCTTLCVRERDKQTILPVAVLSNHVPLGRARCFVLGLNVHHSQEKHQRVPAYDGLPLHGFAMVDIMAELQHACELSLLPLKKIRVLHQVRMFSDDHDSGLVVVWAKEGFASWETLHLVDHEMLKNIFAGPYVAEKLDGSSDGYQSYHSDLNRSDVGDVLQTTSSEESGEESDSEHMVYIQGKAIERNEDSDSDSDSNLDSSSEGDSAFELDSDSE